MTQPDPYKLLDAFHAHRRELVRRGEANALSADARIEIDLAITWLQANYDIRERPMYDTCDGQIVNGSCEKCGQPDQL